MGAVLSGGDDGSSSGAGTPGRSGEEAEGGAEEGAAGRRRTSRRSPSSRRARARLDDESAGYDSARGAQLNSQGFALMSQGDYDGAVPVLQQAVKSFPPGTSDLNYAYALFNLGKSLRLAGRPDEAIPVLEQRLKIPNQTGTVRRELELAKQQAGEG